MIRKTRLANWGRIFARWPIVGQVEQRLAYPLGPLTYRVANEIERLASAGAGIESAIEGVMDTYRVAWCSDVLSVLGWEWI